jgi:hypothetical protein
MKTTLLAMIASTVLGTSAMADNFDYTTTTLTATTGNLEFSAMGAIDNSNLSSEDAFAVGAGAYVLPHTVGTMDAEVFVFGAYGEVNSVGAVALGAEYLLSTSMDASTLTFGVEGAYAALSDDFSNGDVFVTPSVNLEVALTEAVAVFSEVDYAFNASDDFASTGGTIELGMAFAVTDMVAVRPSVVRGFDTADGLDTDTQAAVELTFNF